MRFVQLSDPHIRASADEEDYGISPNRRFAQALEQVGFLVPSPAFVLITGDLVAEETRAAYEQVRSLAAASSAPVRYALGNHDDRGLFRSTVLGAPGSDEPHRETWVDDGIRMVVLDSHVPGEVGGAVGKDQLAWLEATLQAPGADAAVVAVHHPPVPLGVGWLDEHVLADGPALVDVLQQSPTPVARVIFGHVHMSASVTLGSLHLASAPSTAYQFADGVAAARAKARTGGLVCYDVSPGRVTAVVVPIDDPPG